MFHYDASLSHYYDRELSHLQANGEQKQREHEKDLLMLFLFLVGNSVAQS